MTPVYKRFKWSGYEWLGRLHYGFGHQNGRKFWQDPSASFIDGKTGHLHLLTHKNPMQFVTGFPTIGAGFAVSEMEFSYGTFEICCRLPKGKWLWPAFWGICKKVWPPEVDMFEGYSDENGSYKDFQWLNPFSRYAVRTNAWYGSIKDKKNIGARQHSSISKDPSSRFEYFKLLWKPSEMQIFFGNDLVRRINIKRLLEDFKKEKMVIVINNAIRDDARKIDKIEDSDFEIKYFSYKPL